MKTKRIKFGKCPHWKYCKLYDKENKICNEGGGFYGSRYPRCYRRMDDISNKIKRMIKKENAKIKIPLR